MVPAPELAQVPKAEDAVPAAKGKRKEREPAGKQAAGALRLRLGSRLGYRLGFKPCFEAGIRSLDPDHAALHSPAGAQCFAK